MAQWLETKFALSNGTEFWVCHNMGKAINDAFQSWLLRTTDYSVESLCKYINDKNEKYETGHIALTREQYEKLAE